MRRRLSASFAALVLVAFVIAASAAGEQQRSDAGKAQVRGDVEGHIDGAGDTNRGADPEHHGSNVGHLPPSNANVDLVSRLKVSNVQAQWVTDVATYRDTAYLGAWHVRCGETPSVPGGFWSIDISNPANPRELTFVSSPPGTYLTEGLHAFPLTTPTFTGDVLLASQETCTTDGIGGFALYDVSNPAAPTLLGRGADTDVRPLGNNSHSAFGWDAGDKAYVAIVDNQEFEDIDIFDITDPRSPQLIRETGIDEWPAAQDNLAYGEQAFVHDLIVRRVEGQWLMLASYWDAGYVVLNVDDPANPRYIKDSDYPAVDPLLPQIGRPEGNAHEAEWDRCPEEGVRSRFPCGDARYILAADEDFSTHRPTLEVLAGAAAGPHDAGEFSWTVPVQDKFPDGVTGPTVFGGSGCVEDLNENGISDRNEVPPASSIPVAAGETPVIVFERGTCFFSIKVESGQLAGYDVVVIGNHHAGAVGGLFPNAFLCGGIGHEFTPTAAGLCIGHRALHLLFGSQPNYVGPSTGAGADIAPIGTVGARIQARGGVFDGWGYLNLINADTMEHIDHYAVPEALDERYARGFGDLTIHEITTDPTGDVGYIAWYAAGFRVVDYSGGKLKEVGHYIAPEGSDIWGVELNVRRDGRLFTVASDRSYGLYIFRFGTDLQVAGGRGKGTTGRAITVRSTVVNDGTINETNARWTTTLPRGVRALSARASQGRCAVSGRRVTCNLGLLAEDGRARITLRVRSSRAGTLRAQARVTGRQAEYDIGNNTARLTLNVRRARAGAAGGGLGGAALTGRPR